MKKVLALTLGLGTLISSFVFAHGKDDVVERSVTQMESYQEFFDIDKSKPGKYNIMVTAEDKGGNITIGGPYNIYVDPESDLPISGITNPIENMRVPGNLNIVGTCIDDDSVDYVELVLDGDKANPVRAEGKEFWSYYLDTNNLAEGTHTIEVWGVDINGKRGHSKSVSWCLDRRQPITAVTSHELGTLVSGKFDLKGTIQDGNGIKSLTYSLDNGEHWLDAKISEVKNSSDATFVIPIDTRGVPDGPTVCWFRATDKTGSMGVYSFLYFIDNTPPDIQIVYPDEIEKQNGIFTVAGFAKDKIGIQKLVWEFNGESGEFELIPGNPYWYKEINTIGIQKAKDAVFTITGTDIAGNIRAAKRTFNLDQELDKPVVKIETPAIDAQYDGYAGTMFVRGVANDDDGVHSVYVKLDGEPEFETLCDGVFYIPISPENDLALGKHTVTVRAKDIHGIEGNPVTVTFTAKGPMPVFNDPEIKGAGLDAKVTPGISVHPESGVSFVASASAPCGLKKMTWVLESGMAYSTRDKVEPKSPETTLSISLPVDNMPWGLVKIYVEAEDIYGRTVGQTSVLNILNLNRVYTDKPGVVFDDSTVRISDAGYGFISMKNSYTASGYFVGGKAKSVEIVPKTPFATATLDGNTIHLLYGDAKGTSKPVKVRVVTEDNLTYESIPLIFQTDVEPPVISVFHSRQSQSTPENGFLPVRVGGSVVSSVPVQSVQYRIFAALTAMNGDLVTGVEPVIVTDYKSVAVSKNNEFFFELSPDDLPGKGAYAIEVVADNGKLASEVLFVSKIPPKPAMVDGRPANAINPVAVWMDGIDVYSYIITQGYNDKPGSVYKRSEMKAGTNVLKLETNDNAKPDSFTVKKDGEIDVHFATANGIEYGSGMQILLPKKGSTKLLAIATSEFPITAAHYTIEGSKQVGGKANQSGKANVTKFGDKSYNIEIVLENLPAGITKLNLTCDTAEIPAAATVHTTFFVIREPHPKTDDTKKVYWTPGKGVKYDEFRNFYVFTKDYEFNAYANVIGPVTASFVKKYPGLELSCDGNSIAIKPLENGTYKEVTLKVKDSQGFEYTTDPVNLIVDDAGPTLEIVSPKDNEWVQNTVNLTVATSDENGVESVQYTLDGGANWALAKKDGDIFSAKIALDVLEEGLVPIDILATDGAGNETLKHVAVFKDITPPEANVIIPCAEDVVNGENAIAILVKDNGKFVKAEYFPPQTTDKKPEAHPLEMTSMIATFVGTADQPLNDLMTFEFTDASGNVNQFRQWEFLIDAESDLPRAEVHLPEENDVITRDFEISGVIYDDDGPCKLWYKFDNGEYKLAPEEGTSFSIQVPLSTFNDNEHSVTVYAEDVHGVVGPEFTRNFRISLEEPKGEILTPPITETVKDTITMTGIATDKNGIEKVFVSLDNGNSYNEAAAEYGHDKTEVNWSYTFDTRVIQDGTHAVFFKVRDWYGIEGLYSSLINIDNTNPELTLELPLDDSKTRGVLFFSGYTMDNIKLTSLRIKIRSLDGKSVPPELQEVELEPDSIISKAIDISPLEDGFYSVEMSGYDAANNVARAGRNIQLDKNKPAAQVDLLYPLNGEHVQGIFNIYGTATSEVPIERLSLTIDGQTVAETYLTESGYFKYQVSSDSIADGEHNIKVYAYLQNGTTIPSREQTLIYNTVGPWVTIDAFDYGDFAIDRPYIQGNSGYNVSEEDLLTYKDKNTTKELKDKIAAKAVERVEISFNNGKTFQTVSKSGKWRYRVENGEMPDGYHFLLVRAKMKNGEVAVTRLIVQIDKNAPTVRIISPGEGGHFNQQLDFSGLTRDDVALKRVTLALRKGDKASYEVPGFIQGLYLDWQFWGASLFNVGAGLTFFDDNVKLQFQWGQFTKDQWDAFGGDPLGYRYGGDSIMGIKLLANVYYLPFAFLFGPDFDWLAMNIAVGANFSYFSDSGAHKGQFLSAALAQLEFPRIMLEKQKMFRTIAFYTEGQFWLCPSDVSGTEGVEVPTIVPQISFGLRISVF